MKALHWSQMVSKNKKKNEISLYIEQEHEENCSKRAGDEAGATSCDNSSSFRRLKTEASEETHQFWQAMYSCSLDNEISVSAPGRRRPSEGI